MFQTHGHLLMRTLLQFETRLRLPWSHGVKEAWERTFLRQEGKTRSKSWKPSFPPRLVFQVLIGRRTKLFSYLGSVNCCPLIMHLILPKGAVFNFVSASVHLEINQNPPFQQGCWNICTQPQLTFRCIQWVDDIHHESAFVYFNHTDCSPSSSKYYPDFMPPNLLVI